MGLLSKKKAKIKKAKDGQIHEIVCLYCFRNFAHDRVMFRCLERNRAQIDPVLDEYRAKFHMEPVGKLPVVLDPRDFREVNKVYHRGVLSSVKDKDGNITARRICPFCHNDLPNNAGFEPSNIISFVGTPSMDTAVFFTSLVYTLKTVTPRNFSIFCTQVNNEIGRKFKHEYEDSLVECGFLPDPKEKAPPFIFTFSFADDTKPEINIAFFDPLDILEDDYYKDIYSAYKRNSSGIIFTIDPLQFGTISRKLQSANVLNSETYSPDPVDIINDLTGDYTDKADKASNIPTAVVVTKTDLLESIKNDNEYFRPRSRFFTNYVHKGSLNMDEIKNINDEADEFLKAACPNLKNAVQRRFKDVGFFAVSALGADPSIINQKIAAISPRRVDEPFLWILYRLGYIS